MHSLLLMSVVALGLAQQPTAPPAFPPINPAQARLDQTIDGLDGPGLVLACNPEAELLAVGCERGTILSWDADVGMGVRSASGAPHRFQAHQGPLTALAWSGTVLASAGADQKVYLWTVPGFHALHTLTPGGVVRALALAPDAKLLATGSDNGSIQLWAVATGKPTMRLEGHSDWIAALAFRDDGRQLASGSYDGTVRLWDLLSGELLLTLRPAPAAPANAAAPEPPSLHQAVLAVAFSPDHKELAAGTNDGRIPFFTLADGKQARVLTGHTSAVTGLAYHPGGQFLASSSKDRTVRLWNPTNPQPLKVLEGHASWVQGVAFLAHGTRLASVSVDQTMRLWDLAEKK